jgi:drug/metabolite transporter (DMT)-like permease
MSERARPAAFLFLILSLLLQVSAIVLGKTAALHMGAPGIQAFLSNPWYLASLVCLALQAICWQFVLRQIRLFVAYLFTSLNYFLVLAASRLIFLEPITGLHLAGAALITAGVYVVIREDLP